MSSFLLPARSLDVQASDTTGTYWPATDWIPAASVKEVKAVLRCRYMSNDLMTLSVAYQLAETETDKPDAWQELESTPTTITGSNEQLCTGIVDVSAETDDHFYVRFGVLAKVDSGGLTKNADVTLIVSGRD